MNRAFPSIPELIAETAKRCATRPAFLTRRGEAISAVSYGELLESIQKLAAYWRSLGVRRGDAVAIWSENCTEWPLAYFSIFWAGAVVIPIDASMPRQETDHLLSKAKPQVLLYHPKLQASIQGLNAATDVTLVDLTSLHEITRRAELTPSAAEPVTADDLAVIIFTSGTTGFSKGVMLTHGNLTSDALGVIASVHIRQSDNFLLLLPLHHTYSSTVNLLCSIAGGACATFATSYKSRDIVDDIRIGGVTILIGVPQVYENLMRGILRSISEAGILKRMLFRVFYSLATAAERIGVSLGQVVFKSLRAKAGLLKLRLLVSGGAALRPEVNQFFARLGFALVQGYGLTETSPVLAVNRPECNRIGTVGPAVQGAEFKIENPDAEGIGEICARGPMIMRGYFEDEERTAQVIHDGWFHTGDAGRLDPDGCLRITGRIKNVIVTPAGKNIYPEEIEARLNIARFILESLVIGVDPKKDGSQDLFALIVADQSAIQAAQDSGEIVDLQGEIAAEVSRYNDSVPHYRRISGWKLHDQEFEKVSTLKIKRYLYQNLSLK